MATDPNLIDEKLLEQDERLTIVENDVLAGQKTDGTWIYYKLSTLKTWINGLITAAINAFKAANNTFSGVTTFTGNVTVIPPVSDPSPETKGRVDIVRASVTNAQNTADTAEENAQQALSDAYTANQNAESLKGIGWTNETIKENNTLAQQGVDDANTAQKTADNTTNVFIKKAPKKNALDITKITEDTYIDGITGIEYPNVLFNITGLIEITEGEIWKMSNDGVAEDFRHVALYDYRLDFVEGGTATSSNTFTVPTGKSGYMIVSYYAANIKPQLELNTVTEWEQYYEIDKDNNFVSYRSNNAIILEENTSDDAIIKRSTVQLIADSSVGSTAKVAYDNLFNINKYAPNLVHMAYNDSDLARYSEPVIDYTGSTIYVSTTGNDSNDGLTSEQAKATLTGAYNAASNLDIVQILDGTYDLANESSGYLLLNSNSKGVKFIGNEADNTSVILQGLSTGFVIRFRDCGNICFENITMNFSNAGNPKINSEYNSAYFNRIQRFENCIINVDNGAFMYNHSDTGNISDEFNLSFVGCELNIETTTDTFRIFDGSNTFNTLFEQCELNRSGNWGFRNESGQSNMYIYECTINMLSDDMAIQQGKDTDTPTFDYGIIEIRGNDIVYATGKYNHAVLIGRGVKNGLCINNIIQMDDIDNSIALGIVVKSTPNNIGDMKIYSNHVKAPRPFYIKGGANNDIKYNSFINNVATYAPFEYVNFDDAGSDILSTNNLITNNNFIATNNAIILYQAGTTEESDITIQTNEIEDNKYYIINSYLFDGVNSSGYNWANRQTFWTTDKDVDSALLQEFHIPIRIYILE